MTSRSVPGVSFAFLSALVVSWPADAQDAPSRSAWPGAVDEQPAMSVVLEGFVLADDGTPADGAVVVSSAGGKAVADGRGAYRLEVAVPGEAESVQVTAIGAAGGNLTASTRVGLTTGRLARVGPLHLAAGSSCEPRWLPTFGSDGEAGNAIHALAVYDDGSGPALYAGGDFTILGGVPASRIAKWDGTTWTALGPEVFDGPVNALAVFDDGSGPALFVGGSFTTRSGVIVNRVSKWNGVWSNLPGGLNNAVQVLAVFDDGSGPALYLGGIFTTAGGLSANRIARWDGTTWSALGTGLAGLSGTSVSVYAMTVHDDGSGPALHVGGSFVNAGGVTARMVARWDGTSWSALGTGTNNDVRALAVFDDGGGAALYAGGDFTIAGGGAASHVARWDGASWSALAGGTNGAVQALTVYDTDEGAVLVAGTDGGPQHIARWNGASWAPIQGGMNASVLALATFDDGSGPALCAGGVFTSAGGTWVRRTARWSGSTWSPIGPGMPAGPGLGDAVVRALEVHDDGDAPALLAGGSFSSANAAEVRNVARWDGSSWSALGEGLDDLVRALAHYDDGDGPVPYAGGDFSGRVARWDGTSWSVPGGGVGESNDRVRALAVHDDGGGPSLFAAGQFTSAGGVAANQIARWDGSSWSALGSGLGGTATSLAVYDDGGGPALYAGGIFGSAGGEPASGIARWDGSNWSALGAGLAGSVDALTVHDDGGGPALYAGGSLSHAGGLPVMGIARWNGSSWSALGDGIAGNVTALRTHDDGSGPALYAGGSFSSAGGVAALRIARWDGTEWTPLGGGMSGAVLALASIRGARFGGPGLVAGGSFLRAFDSSDRALARWACAPSTSSGKVRVR